MAQEAGAKFDHGADRAGGSPEPVQRLPEGVSKIRMVAGVRRGVQQGRPTFRMQGCAGVLHVCRGVSSSVVYFSYSVFASKTLCFLAAPGRIPPNALMGVIQKAIETQGSGR